MYIINGIAYAGTKTQETHVQSVKPLADLMMIVTFQSGEKRLFDASQLLAYPAFQSLADEIIFKGVQVDHGVVTWADGEIDIAPETMYDISYAYVEPIINT